jgi:ATP-dependent Clp protease adaptor protein ClpS
MAETVTPLVVPEIEQDEKSGAKSELDRPWLVICWNDPINLMTYVTQVFQTVFGWNRQKAEFHMWQVHRQGRSVLQRTTMEKAEHYVHQLQKHTLHATMEREP